jgi:integrase
VLTDTEIKGLKPRPKPYKVSDSGGLHVLVTPASTLLPKGSKLWKCAYRFAGRQKTLSLGAYPDISLGEARARREAAKLQLRQGIDPGSTVKADKRAVVAAATSTFSAVADEWLQKKITGEHKADSTVKRAQGLLKILKVSLGNRRLAEIEPMELLAVLRRVEAAGHHETVARLRAVAGRVFRYGIATGRCKHDVSSDLRGAMTSAISKPRPAIVDPGEVGNLLRAVERFPRPLMRRALQFLALTAVRPGELLSAKWSEIKDGVWSIPADKTKMRTAHRVPLSRQALAVLDELRAITGSKPHLLSSPRKRGQPVAPNQYNYALRDMGFAKDQMVAHGFRAMFSTLSNDNGQSSDVIELCLAHLERNKVRRAYNRSERWPERVALMQWWADHLDGLRERGTVVTLPSKKKSQKGGA